MHYPVSCEEPQSLVEYKANQRCQTLLLVNSHQYLQHMLLLPSPLGARCICYSSRSYVLIASTVIPMHLVSRTVVLLDCPRPVGLVRNCAGEGVLGNTERIMQELGTMTCKSVIICCKCMAEIPNCN